MGSRTRRPPVSRATAPQGAREQLDAGPSNSERQAELAAGGLSTRGGVFRVDHQASSYQGGGQPGWAGSSILVEFAARHPVVGEFALVQAVHSEQIDGGQRRPPSPRSGTNDAAITADSGWRIDSPSSNNPVYGSQGRTSGLSDPHERSLADLSDPPPDTVADPEAWEREHPMTRVSGIADEDLAGEAQVGFRYERGGQVDAAPAALRDELGIAGYLPGAGLEQRFETSALITDGPLQGTWLGSIRWGHTLDARGQVRPIAAEVASEGAPTETFREAAEAWNAGTTVEGPSVDLPDVQG